MAKSNLREIPPKNYIIASAYVIVSIIVIIYMLKWYNVYQEDSLKKAIISDYLTEISYEELPSYLSENNYVVIYTGITDDIACRTYENTFKNIIDNYDLGDDIIYLNITEFSKSAGYLTVFNTIYGSANQTVDQVPALMIIESGKIIKVLDDNLTKQKTIDFLKKYEVIDQ